MIDDILKRTRKMLSGLWSRVPRVVVWAGAALTAVVVIAAVVGIVAASRPSFMGSYVTYEKNYEALQTSLHSELACDDCHVDPRGPVAIGASLVGDFYRGLYDKPDEPVFLTMETPTREACLDCHDEDWSNYSERLERIPHPAHLRVADETRDCVECHKWTAHEEEYIERHKEMPFSGVCASFGCHVGWEAEDECGDCHHTLRREQGEWGVVHKATVQQVGPNGCLETCHDTDQCQQCHTTGERPDFSVTARSADVEAIEVEHVKADWLEQHGSMAIDDDSDCFICHVSVSECESCHTKRPESHGLESTWLTRHQELSEDDSKCLVCHEKDWCEECHDQFKENG